MYNLIFTVDTNFSKVTKLFRKKFFLWIKSIEYTLIGFETANITSNKSCELSINGVNISNFYYLKVRKELPSCNLHMYLILLLTNPVALFLIKSKCHLLFNYNFSKLKDILKNSCLLVYHSMLSLRCLYIEIKQDSPLGR